MRRLACPFYLRFWSFVSPDQSAFADKRVGRSSSAIPTTRTSSHWPIRPTMRRRSPRCSGRPRSTLSSPAAISGKRRYAVVRCATSPRRHATPHIAVIYYAGHGIEVDGTNYLVPIDAVLERDTDAYDEAYRWIGFFRRSSRPSKCASSFSMPAATNPFDEEHSGRWRRARSAAVSPVSRRPGQIP